MYIGRNFLKPQNGGSPGTLLQNLDTFICKAEIPHVHNRLYLNHFCFMFSLLFRCMPIFGVFKLVNYELFVMIKINVSVK